MAVSTDLPIGSELLGYRIEGVLGRGGMGVVYVAEDLRLRRRVALKLLSPPLADDERFRERLLEESELAASLDHPNIVPIYQAGEAEGRIFISMRYVEGRDLNALLREGPLSAEHALLLVSQIASALDAAHARGLVHRDVKPSNVLIAPAASHEGADHVYLADFGLTKRLSGHEASSEQGQLLGTVDYVAPEQIQGDEVDGRADVYSLGCLLYECLTGSPPYLRASDVAVLFAHLDAEPPSAPGLERVLRKALAKSPDDRYQTCRELVDATREGLGLARTRSRRWPLAVGGVVLAAVAAGLLAFLSMRGGGPAAPASTGRLLRIDATTNRVAETASVGSDPSDVAFGARRGWVTSLGDSGVWRIDPKTFAATRFPANGNPLGIAVDGGVAYVAERNGGVTRLDAASGSALDVIPTSSDGPIASGTAGVWFGEELQRFGQAVRLGGGFFAPKVATAARVPDPSPLDEAHVRFGMTAIAVGQRDVWVLGDALDRRAFRIDPRTARTVAAIRLPFAPAGIAVGQGAVWVTAELDDLVARIDPRTNRIVQTIRVGREPTGVAVGTGSVWVANTLDRTVSRIDPATNRVVTTIPIRASPKALAVSPSSVWVAADAP